MTTKYVYCIVSTGKYHIIYGVYSDLEAAEKNREYLHFAYGYRWHQTKIKEVPFNEIPSIF